MSGRSDPYQRKKATSLAKSDLVEIWRPLPDLNRCRRRERAVSWAGLDEGDVGIADCQRRKTAWPMTDKSELNLYNKKQICVNIFFEGEDKFPA